MLKHSPSIILVLFLWNDQFRRCIHAVSMFKKTHGIYVLILKENRVRFDARLDHFPFKVECSTSEVKIALCHECCWVCFPHTYFQPCSYVVFILNNGAAAIMSRHLAKFIRPSTSVLAPLVSAPAQVRTRHFDLRRRTVNVGRRARGKRQCSIPPASVWWQWPTWSAKMRYNLWYI